MPVNAKIPKSFSDLKFLIDVDFINSGITGLPDFSGLTKLTYVRELESRLGVPVPSTDVPWRPPPFSAAI